MDSKLYKDVGKASKRPSSFVFNGEGGEAVRRFDCLAWQDGVGDIGVGAAREKILVVDDEPCILNLMSHTLRYLGYDSEVVNDGQRALELLSRDRYSIVITDIEMPELNGIQLLNHISKRYPWIETIVMTGFAAKYSYTELVKNGAIDFLDKPFRIDELEAKLERVIRERRLVDGLKRESLIRKKKESELLAAKKNAEQASLVKSEFLANMSHEIRTPMNVILGMTRLTLETELTEAQQRYLTVVQQSAESLLGVINDILDLSKIEAGQLVLEERIFEPYAVVKSALEAIEPAANQKGLELSSELSEALHGILVGDNHRLRQILINLLANAIKFTDSGSVSLRAEVIASQGETLVCKFGITDTGPGIPENFRSRLFNRFSQADRDVARRYGGTGLGLSICRNLVTLLGGEIWVESEEGRGSTFYFTARFSRAAAGQKCTPSKEQTPVADSGITRGLDILLVEDNRFNRELALEILKKTGARVTTANNGMEALRKIARRDFAAILMDVEMPEMDGLEATRFIRLCEQGGPRSEEVKDELASLVRQKVGGGHLPIIAMTANAMAGDRERCLAAGMDDYIPKPFVPGDLYGALARVGDKRSQSVSVGLRK